MSRRMPLWLVLGGVVVGLAVWSQWSGLTTTTEPRSVARGESDPAAKIGGNGSPQQPLLPVDLPLAKEPPIDAALVPVQPDRAHVSDHTSDDGVIADGAPSLALHISDDHPMVLSLDGNAALSAHNLMVLQTWSLQLAEQVASDDLARLTWPDESVLPATLREALMQMSAVQREEMALYEQFDQRTLQDLPAFEVALDAARRAHLDAALYDALYAPERDLVVSDDGLQGHAAVLESENENAVNVADTANYPVAQAISTDGEAALKAWHEGEINDHALREELREQLPQAAIEQIIETAEHEREWHAQLAGFLEDYHFVEQAGITGEDELQMRAELLAKHFAPEDRAAAEQFLFSNARTPSHQSETAETPL